MILAFIRCNKRATTAPCGPEADASSSTSSRSSAATSYRHGADSEHAWLLPPMRLSDPLVTPVARAVARGEHDALDQIVRSVQSIRSAIESLRMLMADAALLAGVTSK